MWMIIQITSSLLENMATEINNIWWFLLNSDFAHDYKWNKTKCVFWTQNLLFDIHLSNNKNPPVQQTQLFRLLGLNCINRH